jgi:hypothetical protein
MDVLESYAHQVVSYHPGKVRDDLFDEIYDELCEEFNDWQELNPGSSDADFLNEKREHPMRFATRLAADSSAYLVGPQFYFSFISALKTGAVVTTVFYLFLAIISALASGGYLGSMWRIFIGMPVTLLWVSACILGVFIALEKGGERATWLDDWKASDLKPLDSHQQISRGETLFDLALSTLALLWLAGFIQAPGMIFHDGEWITGWTISLPDGFWVAAAVMLVFNVAFSLFRLTRPLWSRPMRLTTIVSNLLWLALLGFAIAQPDLLAVDNSVPDKIQGLMPITNAAVRGLLSVVFAILAWEILVHAWRLKR